MKDLVESLEDADDQSAPLSCFVICPIGDEHAEIDSDPRQVWEDSIEIFEQVIEPACRAFGVEPTRADQIAEPGEIPAQVFRRLKDDDIVIADLTGGNPNVMYELGLRHTTGKLTIQLGEKDRLPFDVAAIRTIMFRRTAGGLVQARKRLAETLSAGLRARDDSRLTVAGIWQASGGTAPEDPDFELAGDEAGFLEKLADLETNVVRLPELMTETVEIMRAMTKFTLETREEADRINQSKGPASARLAVANKLAKNLEPHADELAEIAKTYDLAVEKVGPGVRHILGAEASDDEEREKIEEFKGVIAKSLDAAEKYVKANEELRERLKTSGEATRLLRRVNGRISSSLQKLNRSTGEMLAWRSLL
jgi:hypothetical protein